MVCRSRHWRYSSDNQPGYRPGSYEATALQTRLSYAFHSYKLLDQDPEALAADPNPFALVLLTALESLRAGKLSDESLIEQKLRLYRKLLGRGYDKETISRLGVFIQYYVKFAKPETHRTFTDTLSRFTSNQDPMGIIETVIHEEKKEAYEQGVEIGVEKGVAIGVEKGVAIGIEQSVEKLLLKGLDVQATAELLDVPVAQVEKVAERLRKDGRLL
ncbi:MAG: hypothetical protein OHK0039_00850 [Bacteroidia bacterium]